MMLQQFEFEESILKDYCDSTEYNTRRENWQVDEGDKKYGLYVSNMRSSTEFSLLKLFVQIVLDNAHDFPLLVHFHAACTLLSNKVCWIDQVDKGVEESQEDHDPSDIFQQIACLVHLGLFQEQSRAYVQKKWDRSTVENFDSDLEVS